MTSKKTKLTKVKNFNSRKLTERYKEYGKETKVESLRQNIDNSKTETTTTCGDKKTEQSKDKDKEESKVQSFRQTFRQFKNRDDKTTQMVFAARENRVKF